MVGGYCCLSGTGREDRHHARGGGLKLIDSERFDSKCPESHPKPKTLNPKP